MSKDITRILEGWGYKPGEIQVRRIMGSDGRPRIQMRMDMGLVQMELSGRPDGKRVYGKPSLLEYYFSLIRERKARYGTDAPFRLEAEDCVKLQSEAVQYYHRYLACFVLEEYEGVARDTDRNLRVFDLMKRYASDEVYKWAFEQYRPYVVMMNTRAKGLLSLRGKAVREALMRIQAGIRAIERFFEEYHREDLIEESEEILFLKRWAEEIEQNRPRSPVKRLQKALDDAVEHEEYEKAMRLRDRIREMEAGTNQAREIVEKQERI